MKNLTLFASLIALALTGCWDFASLTNNGARNLDGGNGEDLYTCSTERSATREDCTNGIDDNNDCLVDCDDPECSDAIKCIDKNNLLIGYGALHPTTDTCAGNQTTTPVNQGLMLAGTCSGCACQANTNWKCTSTLHWADSPATNCTNAMFANMAALSGNFTGSTCVALTTAPVPKKDSSFKVDNIVSICPVDSTATGTPQVTWTSQQKLCTAKGCDTLDCMQRAGATCLAFSGDFSCPAPFTVKVNTWYESLTDNRTCTCSCGGSGTSCNVVAATDAQLYDTNNCGGNNTQAIAQGMVNSCQVSNINNGNAAAMSMSFTPRPQCVASGTTTMTDLNTELAAGHISLNTPITTCCTP